MVCRFFPPFIRGATGWNRPVPPDHILRDGTDGISSIVENPFRLPQSHGGQPPGAYIRSRKDETCRNVRRREREGIDNNGSTWLPRPRTRGGRCPPNFLPEPFASRFDGFLPKDENGIPGGVRGVPFFPYDSFDSISDRGGSNLSSGDKTDFPGGRFRIENEGEKRRTETLPGSAGERESASHHAESILRPLARRLLMTLRPPAVLMRLRNPIFLFLFLLWGR